MSSTIDLIKDGIIVFEPFIDTYGYELAKAFLTRASSPKPQTN